MSATTCVKPSAQEMIHADEAALRGSWLTLAEIVETQADALVEVCLSAVARSREFQAVDRYEGTVAELTFIEGDPVGEGDPSYLAAARALGVL